MDQAIDINVYGTYIETEHRQVGKDERPFCEFCSSRAVVGIDRIAYEHGFVHKITYMCASHFDSFEFGTLVGQDYEKVWL